MSKQQMVAIGALAILAALALYLHKSKSVQISYIQSRASPYNAPDFEAVNKGMNVVKGASKKLKIFPDKVSLQHDLAIERDNNKFPPGMYENVSSHETYMESKAVVAVADQSGRLQEVSVVDETGDRRFIKVPGDRNDLL